MKGLLILLCWMFCIHTTMGVTDAAQPTCIAETKFVDYNKTVQAINENIVCLNRSNTNAKIDCSFGSKKMSFLIEGPPTYIQLTENPEKSCLQLTSTNLPDNETCVYIYAENTEERNVRSKSPLRICIVFNKEGPIIIPNQFFKINAADGKEFTDISPSLTSSDNISSVQIQSVEPKNFSSFVNVTRQDTALFRFGQVSMLDKNKDIIVTFTVTDDGNPRSTSIGQFIIQLFNDTITCTNQNNYLVKIYTTKPGDVIGPLECESSYGNITAYTMNRDSNFALTVLNDNLVLNTSDITDISNRSVELNVSSSSGSSKSFVFTVLFGFAPVFAPSKINLYLTDISPIGTCIDGLSVNTDGDIQLSTDIFIMAANRRQFCLQKSLQSQPKQDYNITFNATIENSFGSDSAQIYVEVKAVREMPVITISKLTANLTVNTPQNSTVIYAYVFPENTSVNLTDESVPFVLKKNNSTDFEINLQGDIVEGQTYNITILAMTTFGDSSSKTVSLTVLSNSPPTCSRSTLSQTLAINSTVGTTLLPIICMDGNGDSINFQFSPDTPQYVKDTFELQVDVAANLTVTLKKPLTDLDVNQLKGLEFNVIVSDGRSTISVTVKITITVPNPVCVDDINVTIRRTENGICLNSSAPCSNDYGFAISYTFPVVNRIPFEINGTLQKCNVSEELTVGTYQTNANLTDGFNEVTVPFNVKINGINESPPKFLNVINNMDTVYVNETEEQGGIIYTFSVQDTDFGDFGKFNIEENGLSNVFNLNKNGSVYTLIHNTPLKSSVAQTYNLSFVARDKGGLSSTLNLTVIINDINEAPTCINNVIFNTTVASPIGTIIGTLDCTDSDTKPEYNQISYSLPASLPFALGTEGSIRVKDKLLDYPDTLHFNVSATSAELTTLVDVTVYVNRNFPPTCNATSLQTTFVEKASDCSQKQIRCKSSVDSQLSWTVVNNQTTEIEVYVDNSTTGQLDIRICPKPVSNRTVLIFKDSVEITVKDDLGTESIVWNVEVQDVNDPPRFENATYNFDIPEFSQNGTIIGSIYLSDTNDPVGIRLYDTDTNDEFKIKNIATTVAVVDKRSGQTLPGVTSPIEYDNMDFSVYGKLDPRHIYRYTIEVRDGGNLNGSTVVNFKITDVNQQPSCSSFNKTLSLLHPTKSIFGKVSCSDPDIEADFQTLSYNLQNKDLFGIANTAELYLNKKLPRDQSNHNFVVLVSDRGNPPLATSANVFINVDRDIGANCNPTVTPPQVWLKDECITIDSVCTDPTTEPGDTTTLKYSVTGNYTNDFYIYNTSFTGSDGVLKLCYNKTQDGEFYVSMSIDNGLKIVTKAFQISVKYLRSVPVFSSDRYEISKTENTQQGAQLLVVQATSTGNYSGNVTYRIKDVSPMSAESFFALAEDGTLKASAPLKQLSGQEIVLTIEAEDDRSKLSSTATVTLKVDDENEKPVCSDDRTLKLTVDASVPTGYIIHTFNCSDPDTDARFNNIKFSLNGSTYFRLQPETQTIETTKQLPVTDIPIDLYFSVDDGSFETVVKISVNISFQPSTPKLEIADVGIYNVELKWSYERPESLQLVQRHIVKMINPTEKYFVLTASTKKLDIKNLNESFVYSFIVIAETSNKNLTSNRIFVTTKAIPELTNIMVAFRVTNRAWSDSMVNRLLPDYKKLKEEAEVNLMKRLSSDPGLHRVTVINIRPGSVIFDAALYVNQTGSVNQTETNFRNAIYNIVVGDLEADPKFVEIYRGDLYISKPSLNLVRGTENSLLENTLVTHACTFRLVSLNGDGKVNVQWFLDDAPLILSHSSRIKLKNSTITNDRFGYRYTVDFDNASASHSGNLTCRVSNGNNTVTASATKRVDIISKPVVTLWPLTALMTSGSTKTLHCTSVLPSSNPVTYQWFNVTGTTTVAGENSSTLTVTMEETDLEFKCIVRSAAGKTESDTSHLIFDKPTTSVKPCLEETDIRNTTWPSVRKGAIVRKECGPGYDGFARRNCSETGGWLPPDYSNCRKTNLIILKRKTEDVKEGKLVETPENTLKTLVNLTEEANGFSAGDVETSVQILRDIVDINNDDKGKTIGKEELQNFAKSAANVLNADDEEWSTLSTLKKSGIAALIETVDQFANLTSSRLIGAKTLTAITPKIVIEVARSNLRDIEFPKNDDSTYPDWVSGSRNKVFLHKDSLARYFKDGDEVGYNAVFYNDVTNILEDMVQTPGQTSASPNDSSLDINSRILAFSLSTNHSNVLDPPIELTFQHISENYSNPQCAFLDFTPPYENVGRWLTDGCTTVSTSNPNITICKCNHLTNFAILMSPGKTPVHHITALSIISVVGCAISLFCLLLTICIYIYLWNHVKNDKAVILMNLCGSLIISYVIFIGGVNQTEHPAVCTSISALLHFFYLVVFFLMLAEGMEVFISVVYVFATKSRLKWILLGSWGIPAIIVGVSLGVTQLEGYGNDDFCWLSLESGLVWAFVGPALVVIVINMAIMIKVLTVMFSTTTMVTKSMKEKGRTGLKALCVLLPIMGLTWVFGVFSVNEDWVIFQYLFAIFNSLQGLFIFIFHCLMSRQIKDGFKMKRRRYRAKSIDTGTKSFTQVPLNTNQTRSTSDSDKPTNDLDKKTSQFSEVDRRVQQLAKKLEVDSNNIKANLKKENIVSDNKVITSKESNIFSDIRSIVPETSLVANTSLQDLYRPAPEKSSGISSKTGEKDDGRQTASNKTSARSDRSQTRDEVKERPRSQDVGDNVSARNMKKSSEYSRLKERDPATDHAYLYPTSRPIQTKMPSIEDNSQQQGGYFPNPSDYPSKIGQPVLPDPSSQRKAQMKQLPDVYPKPKPKQPKGVPDLYYGEEKIDNTHDPYGAFDAYYIGPQSKPQKEYPAQKKTSSNPNLSQNDYVSQYPPTDKWANLKKSKITSNQQPYSQVPMQDTRRRIHSNDDLAGYRSHVYKPFGGVQVNKDNREISMPRQHHYPSANKRYNRGYNEPRRDYR